MFAEVPRLSQLIESRWLYLLVGDMESHIQVLRIATDLWSKSGYDAKLVVFLGGDKLSITSPPHLPHVKLTAWGPVDELLIMNARRPVDFSHPGANDNPHSLPGCIQWKRDISDESLTESQERIVGVLWICRALTVPREPYIHFRACSSSIEWYQLDLHSADHVREN